MALIDIALLFLLFVIVFILPGTIALLYSRHIRYTSILCLVSFGFVVTTTAIALLGLAGILAGIKTVHFVPLLVIILITPFLLALYRCVASRGGCLKIDVARIKHKIRVEDIGFLAIAIITFLGVLYYGAFLRFGDVWLHVAYVTKFFDADILDASYPFFREVVHDTNYGYCPLYILYSVLPRLLGHTVLWTWYYLPAIIVLLILVVNYYFARLLTQSRFVALVSVVFLLYFMGMIGSPFLGFGTAAFPRNITVLLISPLLWLLVIQSIRFFNRMNLALLFAGYALLLMIHKLSAFHFLVLYMIFGVIVIATTGRRHAGWYRRVILILAYMIMALFVYVIIVPFEPVVNPLHLAFRQEEILKLGKTPFSIASPVIFLFQAGPITSHDPRTPLPLFSYLLLPALFLSPKRNSLGKIYLLSAGILLPVTIFNPLLFPLLTKVLTVEGSIRMVQIIPFHLIFPYAMYLIVQNTLPDLYRTLRQRRQRKYITAILSIGVAIVFLLYIAVKVPHEGRILKTEEQLLDLNPLFKAADYIRDNFNVTEERLMADFYSSYVVSALSGIEVMGIPETMSSPNHSFVWTRNLVVYRFFSNIPPEKRYFLAQRFGISLVLLNPEWIRTDRSDMVKKFVAEFSSLPSLYSFIETIDDLFLYRVESEEIN